MRRIATVLTVGFACGLLSVVLAIGHGGLLAQGSLDGHLSAMIGVALVSAGVTGLATAFLSTIPGQITTTQQMSTVALAGVAAAAATGVAAPLDEPARLATVLVAIGLTTALSGAGMFLLGLARLGRIVRFVPYPVFGGILAITGWYLLQGGLEIVVGPLFGRSIRQVLSDPSVILKLGFALCFVALVHVSRVRLRSELVLLVAVVAAMLAFNLVVWLAGLSPAGLRAAGWIIAAPEAGGVWPPVGPAELARVDWGAVLGALVLAPIVMLTAAAAAIMNVSAIELGTEGDVDLNRELRPMGIGNLLSGLLGGMPGFPSVSGTLLAARLGASDRLTAAVSGCVAIAGVAFAPQLISVMPAPLLGALLMSLGVVLLIEWLVNAWLKLTPAEYAVVLLILAVSIVAGFPAGIVTGLTAALAVFVVEYSRVATARFIGDARDYQAALIPDTHREVLEARGGAICIVRLSGYVFFGTGDRLVQQVAARAAGPHPLRFVLMDFRRVNGVDSSVVMSFVRLRRLARRDGFVVVLAGLSEPIRARLELGGIDLGDGGVLRAEPDLDAALRWAAGRLLEADAPTVTVAAGVAAGEALARFLGDEGLARALCPYLEHIDFPAGARVIEQGARSDDIYFIEDGEGVVQLEPAACPPIKLAEFGGGAILGEIAFYRGEPRTASVIARTPISASRLTRAALERIDAELPALAARFHQQMVRTLAGRLQSANHLIRVLAD